MCACLVVIFIMVCASLMYNLTISIRMAVNSNYSFKYCAYVIAYVL